jgi:hypothetical protein
MPILLAVYDAGTLKTNSVGLGESMTHWYRTTVSCNPISQAAKLTTTLCIGSCYGPAGLSSCLSQLD